jgi:hypothetical protein
MTLIRAIGQQWTKSTLAHRLSLCLLHSRNVQQLFGGATSLNTVTHTISALVFTQGQPLWLPPIEDATEQALSPELTLHCLFEASRLLFVKELEQGQLTQAEHLILTIANQWSVDLQKKPAKQANVLSKPLHEPLEHDLLGTNELSDNGKQLCHLLQTIHTQLEQARSQQRQGSRNMGRKPS